MGSFLKMRLSTAYAEWPKWVESEFGQINPIRVSGPDVHITHINHSTVLIQIAGYNLLTDPIFSARCSPVSWAGPRRVRNPGIRFTDLPPIDLVLISHDHYDHLDLPTIERLIERDNPTFFVGLGVEKRLPASARVIALDWWEKTVANEKIALHFVETQHFSGRGLFDRDSTLWGGFVIEAADRRIYFGGDTGYHSHFRETLKRFGKIDIALLPIGAYEPRDFMGYAHLNPHEAVQAHLDLQATVSIGIHYGTFQLTAEPYDAPLAALQQALREFEVPPEHFLTPPFGEVLRL